VQTVLKAARHEHDAASSGVEVRETRAAAYGVSGGSAKSAGSCWNDRRSVKMKPIRSR
jgi:ribose/xylose/arabinose/galactoside ABC-type transport system permease subunit